jgi:tetratricopeptide (TPR) repeat protein
MLLTIFIVSSCSKNDTGIIDPRDYDRFLKTDDQAALEETYESIAFWSNRLRPDSTGIGELTPLANSYTRLFELTGNITHLKNAEVLLKKAYSLPSLNKDQYGRSLAHNYIAQHRFREALQLLEKIYADISNKRSTELMLFDAYLEAGEYDKAYKLLDEFENKEDFEYLIRLVRWNDYKGNSDTVIRTMERAKDIAESRGDKDLMVWTYNNLATVYGHSGRINESYHYFLRSLEIQPYQVVPKTGIAWIAFSFEGNSSEANRIVDSIMVMHRSPDHILFKSILADFDNDGPKAERYRKEFINQVESKDHGFMYHADLIDLYSETDPLKGFKLAEIELENRSTPVIYSMYAYAILMKGDTDYSIQIIENHVLAKTHEPLAYFYAALIFHKAGKMDRFEELMELIEEAQFELGPVRMRELRDLFKN